MVAIGALLVLGNDSSGSLTKAGNTMNASSALESPGR